MQTCDLHTHSSASDGDLTPAALVEKACNLGISTLALTDHDSTAGLAEARSAAALANLEFIPGIEIEIDFEPGEFHLLGYGIDETAPQLVEAVEKLAYARQERNSVIIARMMEAKLPLDFEQIEELSRRSYLGRPHLADFLVEAHCARDRQDAFDRDLGKGKPFYIKKACLPLEEALSVIHGAGGVAVVAHPYSLFVSKIMLSRLFDQWKAIGIGGIEAYHPTAKYGQCVILERMARERKMFVTAGSDFHGKMRPECGLGHTAGNMLIDMRFRDELVAALREAALKGFSQEAPSSFNSR
jgi:predicted metal-dependent phosphoesterase TrpH